MKALLYLVFISIISVSGFAAEQCRSLFVTQTKEDKNLEDFRELTTKGFALKAFIGNSGAMEYIVGPGLANTRYAKVIRALNRKGIVVAFSPMKLEFYGASGAFMPSQKKLYVNLKDILEDKINFVLLHEIRHATNYLKSIDPNNQFERLMQTIVLIEPQHILDRLPGANLQNHYKQGFALDEILAHRQSAVHLLKSLKSLKDRSSSEMNMLLNLLKDHGLRLENFIEAWMDTTQTLKQDIKDYGLSIKRSHQPEDILTSNLLKYEFGTSGQSFFSKLKFWLPTQNEKNLRLKIKFLLLPEEAISFEKLSSKEQAEFVYQKIQLVSNKLEKLYPLAKKFNQSVLTTEQLNLNEAIDNLQQFNAAISDLRIETNL